MMTNKNSSSNGGVTMMMRSSNLQRESPTSEMPSPNETSLTWVYRGGQPPTKTQNLRTTNGSNESPMSPREKDSLSIVAVPAIVSPGSMISASKEMYAKKKLTQKEMLVEQRLQKLAGGKKQLKQLD